MATQQHTEVIVIVGARITLASPNALADDTIPLNSFFDRH